MMNSELTELIYRHYVQPEVLTPLETNDLKLAIVPISCVRSFDSVMLKRVVQAAMPSLFGMLRTEDFGDLMLRLKRTGLLVWEKGNAINPSIRHLIAGYLRDNEPEMFRVANQVALDVYQKRLALPVDNRSLFVVEELFHTATLDGQTDLVTLFKKRLNEYPNWYRDKQVMQTQRERLGDMLRSDAELGGLTFQIPEMLGML